MKIICIIPARYNSTRLHGKPLLKIVDKPMIWWTYNNANKVKYFDKVIVATDHEKVMSTCKSLNINSVMTPVESKSALERVYHASKDLDADLIVSLNGDEPMLSDYHLNSMMKQTLNDYQIHDFFVANAVTLITDPVEALDHSNIKVVFDEQGNGIYFSRQMIPYPKSNLDYNFYKHVGFTILTPKALDFYFKSDKGPLEIIEDIDQLRFIENGVSLKIIKNTFKSLSVDYEKDLKIVRKYLT